MTTRLQLYNNALLALGERKLASLSENRESRRVLDQVWDDGFVDSVLEQGYWNFAIRTIELEYEPSIEPDFGYQRAFVKPDDYIRTAAICSDEFFNEPLLSYSDEANYWFAEIDTIYVKYVSNDEDYGNNLGEWPETFTDFAQALLASKVSQRITQSDSKTEMMEKKARKALVDARSKDAMAEPPTFMPTGNWVRSRHRRTSRTSRFNTNGTLNT